MCRKKESLRDGTTGGCLEERVKDFLGHLGRMCEAEEQKVNITVTMEDFMEALLVYTHTYRYTILEIRK